MNSVNRLLRQRSSGHVQFRVERSGVAVLREAGSAKVRIPRGTSEAILINTSGGLAGGDTHQIEGAAGPGAMLSITTQAAERVYRTLGPAAEVSVSLRAEAAATLMWLPQETILFENSALARGLDVTLGDDATFLAVEPLVFGRHEMGETIRHVSAIDRWFVRQQGKLIHAEAFRLGPDWHDLQAGFAGNRAAATLLLVSPNAETTLDSVRRTLAPEDGASAWNGKLVARFLARDGFSLRKKLIQAIQACAGTLGLPKCWTL